MGGRARGMEPPALTAGLPALTAGLPALTAGLPARTAGLPALAAGLRALAGAGLPGLTGAGLEGRPWKVLRRSAPAAAVRLAGELDPLALRGVPLLLLFRGEGEAAFRWRRSAALPERIVDAAASVDDVAASEAETPLASTSNEDTPTPEYVGSDLAN